jgi:polysaccharide transporter, PST family
MSNKIFNTIFKNYSLVNLSQGVNILVPILLTPFFIKKFTVEDYSVFVLSQAIIVILNVIADYNFSSIGIKKLTLVKGDFYEINTMCNKIFFSKISLLITLIIVFFLLPFFVDLLFLNIQIYYYSVFLLIGFSFQNQWFFLVFDNLKVLALFNFIGKSLYVLIVLIFIRNSSQASCVNLINGLLLIIFNFIPMYLLVTRKKLKIQKVALKEIYSYLSEGLYFVFSNFLINLYKGIPIILISKYFDANSVRYFSIAEKIVYVPRIMVSNFASISFPFLSNEIILDTLKNSKRIFLYFALFFGTFIALILIFEDPILMFFVGNSMDVVKSKEVLNIIIWAPVFTFLNIFPFQLLILKGFETKTSHILIMISVLSMFSILFFSKMINFYAVLYSIVFTEICFVLIFYSFIFKRRLLV